MTETLKGLLLDDCWAPITSEMGFLELGAEFVARSFAAWQAELLAPRGVSLETRRVSGSLDQTLSFILPISTTWGCPPFEEDFYLPEGHPAWLVERKGPVSPRHKDFTLAQAREDF